MLRYRFPYLGGTDGYSHSVFAQTKSKFLPSLATTLPYNYLNYNDISVDDPANLSIIKGRLTCKCSKTDPFRHGVDVHVGQMGQVLCPVSALLNYPAVRGRKQGLLFHFSDGSLLTKSKFVDKFRTLLHQAGIDESLYSGHSFCIGAVSTVAVHGVKTPLFKL